MKIKISDELFFKLIVISIFVFNYEFRARFFPIIKDINILFLISMLAIYFRHKFHINKLYFWGILFLFIYNLLINQLTNSPSSQTIYFNVCSILPLLLLGIKIKPNKHVFSSIIKLYNLFIYILFIIFLIDLASNNALSRILTAALTTYPSNWMPSSSIGTRYRFYFAHPLYSSALVMVFYAINMICFKKNIETNIKYWPLQIITSVLLLAFGSKTAIVLFVIVFYIFNFTPKRLIIGIALTVSLYFSGAMDFILNRFDTETSLTSGRNEALKMFFPKINIFKQIYSGYGEKLMYNLTNMIGLANAGASQEYPIITYYLRYGLIFTIGIVTLQFIDPLIDFIKSRNFYLAFFLIVIYLELNMFNGLVYLVDVDILYVTMISLFKLVDE